MMNRTVAMWIASVATALGAAGAGLAQAPGASLATSWSDPEIESVAKMLSGTWKTSAPVGELGGGGAKADVFIAVVPAHVEGVSDALYAETARADSLQAPYRQAIFQLYRFKGGLRLRTYEFLNRSLGNAIVGLWAVPDKLPKIARTDLVATLDLDLTKSGAGYAAKTPYPYPTGIAGAVEMTSELMLAADALTTRDRGIGADGKVVWGAADNESVAFKKFAPPVKVDKTENGLIVIRFTDPTEGDGAAANDRMVVHYSGWRTDGFLFDSSREKGAPATLTLGSLIPGWNAGLAGSRKGSMVRLYIPAGLAYGERGAGWRIPPNSDLIFDVEVLAIEKAPPVDPTPGDQPGATEQPKQ